MMYKSGSFYKAFGKDAYILSAMFDYSIKMVNQNIPVCGFPLSSIMKVRSTIEEKKINYMILNPRNNYDVEIKEDFRNLNNFHKEFETSYTKTKRKKKITHIVEELKVIIDEPCFKEKIRKIEDILDEN